MPAFSPCLIILYFLPSMFLVSSLTPSTFSSSSLSPKFKVTISNPEKEGGILFPLSPSLCLQWLWWLLLLTLPYRGGEWEPTSPLLLGLCGTLFHQAQAAGMCEMQAGARPSAGAGDRCWVGSTAPRGSGARWRICFPGRNRQCQAHAASRTLPCRGGEQGLFSPCPRGCHQPLQGTAVNTCKEGDHSSLSST